MMYWFMNSSRKEFPTGLGNSDIVSLKFARDHSQSSSVSWEEGETPMIGRACWSKSRCKQALPVGFSRHADAGRHRKSSRHESSQTKGFASDQFELVASYQGKDAEIRHRHG